MMIIMCWIQVVVVLFCLITRSLIPQFRAYPANMSLWMLLSFFIAALGKSFIPAVAGGWRQVICSGGVSSGFGVGSCVMQYVLHHLGTLWSNLWWANIALHTAISVGSEGRVRFNWKTNLVSHVVCWGIPILTLIIALGQKIVGGRQTITFCFISIYPQQHALLWWIVLVCLTVALPCIIFSVVKMHLSAGSSNESFYLKNNIRMLLFLLLFLITTVVTVITTFWILASSFLNNVWPYWSGLYNTCSIQTDQCDRGQVFSYGWNIWFNICNYTTGTLIAIAFMVNRSYWKSLFDIVTCKSSILASATTGTTAGSSSSGSSSAGTDSAAATFTQDY